MKPVVALATLLVFACAPARAAESKPDAIFLLAMTSGGAR